MADTHDVSVPAAGVASELSWTDATAPSGCSVNVAALIRRGVPISALG